MITKASKREDVTRTGPSILRAKLGALFLRNIQLVSGMAITVTREMKISFSGVGMEPTSLLKYANEKLMINGIVKMVVKLLIAVKEIESGKSPLDKSAIILELAPPGQATNIISPMSINGYALKVRQSPKPTRGNKIIWLNRLIRAGWVICNTFKVL